MPAQAVIAGAAMTSFYTPKTYKARDSIGYLVRRAGNLMTTRVEAAFARHEVTFAQWLVLMKLRDGLGSTAAEIARDMCHDSGALTRVIDQLSQRGFVERARCLEDRRVVTLKLTPNGLKMVNSLLPTVIDLLNRALADFTPEETTILTHLLHKLVVGITAVPAPEAAQLEPLS